MRPLRLKLENFMSFRHAEIDLSRQDIFVITGPTGSGKTTLLDAMSFALYGETPRMGKQGQKELIFRDVDHPRLEARVEFEFSHRGKEYQIIRQIGKSSHRIELAQRLPGENWKSDSSYSSKSFQDWAARLLGLNSEAFTRVLVLPQGGFDKFLRHDKPAERRELMLKLSQLEIYQDIHQLAQIEADQLKRQLDTLQLQRQHLASSSPEYLAQLQAQQSQLTQNIDRVSQNLETFTAHLRLQEAQWQLQTQIVEQTQQLHSLQTQTESMQSLLERWQKGLKLLQLAPLLEQEAQLNQQAVRIQQAQAEQAQKQGDWQAQFARFQVDYQSWQARESQRSDWLELQTKYQGLQGLVNQFQQQSQSWKQTQKEFQALQMQQAELTQRNTQAQNQLDQFQVQKSQLLQAFADLNWNEERYDALQEALPLVQNLYRQWMPDFENRQEQLIALEQELKQLQAKSEKIIHQIEAREHELAQVQTQLVELQAQLEHGQQAERAADLQQHLIIGHDCPVCKQIVTVLPQLPELPALSQTQQAIQHVQTQLKQSQLTLQELQKKQHDLDRETYSRQQKYQDLSADRDALSQKIQIAKTELQTLLGSEIAQDTLAAEYKKTKELKKQKLSFEEQLKQVQQSELRALQNLSQTQQDLNRLASQLEIQARHLDQKKSECQQSETQLQRELNVSQDFETVLQSHLQVLKTQLIELDQHKQQIEQRQSQLEREQIRIESRIQELAEQAQDCQTQSDTLQQKLDISLRELGLERADEARQFMLPETELNEIHLRYQQWQSKLAAAQQLLNNLQAQFTGPEIHYEQIEQSQQNLKSTQQDLQNLNLELGLLEQKIQQTQTALQQSQELQAKINLIDHEYQLYGRIVEDLATKKLPDFIYHRILERVITQGSQELFKLSQERYRFAIQSEELVVLDAWNAHEPRSIKTLSGGESFMASLALALALNEYLSAGAHLGALFIDEGFGTLDPESLEHAAEVLEVLRARGKCIGVITHIPELAERFEARIQITKSSQGSRIDVIAS